MDRTDRAAATGPGPTTPDGSCGSCGAPRPAAAPPQPGRPAGEIDPGTHCEWCGAEYETPAVEDRP